MTTNKVCGKGKCKFTDEFCASGDCPYDPDVLKKTEKIKHIAEVKNLAAVYQVAERTLSKINEVLK